MSHLFNDFDDAEAYWNLLGSAGLASILMDKDRIEKIQNIRGNIETQLQLNT